VRAEPPLPDAALAAIRAPFLGAGAEAVDPPILQPLGLLLDLAGEAMRTRLFVVQAQGGEEACLRPDFTVPVVRLHKARGAAAGRYLYEGKAFRASPDHPDRPEEFLQIGLERFDPASASKVEADAEIAALAWRAAQAGGRGDLSLWLGDIALFAAFVDGLDLAEPLAARLKRSAFRPRLLQAELARAGAPAGSAPFQEAGGGRLADLLAGLSATDAADLLEEVWALAGVEPVGGRGPAETPDRAFAAVAAMAGPKARALKTALGDWARRLDLLHQAGAPLASLRFATALGHAFDYYDGLTFEIRSRALGPDRPVAVGGRYDGLPARLGAVAASAVGCMVRPWRALAGGEA